MLKLNEDGTLNSQSLPPFFTYPHYNSWISVCVFVCRATPSTVVGRLHPDLLHRISMTPINVWGVFIFAGGLERGRGWVGVKMQILYVNVYRVAPHSR